MPRKKKKTIIKAVLPTVIALAALTIAVYYFSLKKYEPRFARYRGFGIDIPINYSIHGIDVSRHQSNISWKDVKEMQDQDIHLSFAFIKATEGLETEDDQFDRNWKNARKQQLARGAYHFFIPTKSGRLQARSFINTVDLEPGDLPPVLDVEQSYGANAVNLQKEVGEWLKTIEAYYHVRPIIYTNVDFYNTYLAGKFEDYPLWVAHYLVKDKPRISRPWAFWQHNEKGRVNGIDAYVDFNVFSGDSLAFDQLLLKQ